MFHLPRSARFFPADLWAAGPPPRGMTFYRHAKTREFAMTLVLISFAPIAILLAFGAFFSGSETALTAVSRGRMHQLEKDGSRSARDVNVLVSDRERLIGALLLGNTFVNILA